MEGEASEFQDWEVLNSSDTGLVNSSDSAENPRNLAGVEDDTEGMIRSDYFSLDNQGKYPKTVAVEGDVSEEGSIESDNPSWIDPGSETHYARKNSSEFWSDSGSDPSEDRKFSDFAAKNGLDYADNMKNQVGLDGIGKVQNVDKDSSNFWSDSGGDGLVSKEIEGVGKADGMKLADLDSVNNSIMELEGDGDSAESERGAVGEVRSNESSDVGEKRTVVWWKVPFELLRYCVFRVNPVWTFSVAAAVMGFVILGRRLYKMKRKSQSLQLKVTMDDKVSFCNFLALLIILLLNFQLLSLELYKIRYHTKDICLRVYVFCISLFNHYSIGWLEYDRISLVCSCYQVFAV